MGQLDASASSKDTEHGSSDTVPLSLYKPTLYLVSFQLFLHAMGLYTGGLMYGQLNHTVQP